MKSTVWLGLFCASLIFCFALLGANQASPSIAPAPPTAVESVRTAYARGHSGHYTAWVQYTLTPESLRGETAKRPTHFTADDRQPQEYRWSEADYAGSGFDIGHCFEAAAARGEQSERDTFILTNTMPQVAALNRGQWARLEAFIRGRVESGDTATVAVGPSFLPDAGGHIRIATIGKNKIWVPTHCWKAVLFTRKGDAAPCEALAWLLPNRDVDDFGKFAVSVDELEAAIGFDLWAGLPDEQEAELEGAK